MQTQNRYTQDDSTFLIVEQLIAVICIFIPLFLCLSDNLPELRESISAYVDMNDSYIFGMLLTIAAMLFIFNGALYFKTNVADYQTLSYKKNSGKWYNIILGVALLGVVIFPHNRSLHFLHFGFALIFFFGSAFFIFKYHDPKHKWISRIIAIVSITSLLVCLFSGAKLISVFWAETIALIIIGIHYILESMRILTVFGKTS